MEKLVEIKKVIIKIGKNEFTISLEEARALKQILEDMFGERTIYVPSYTYTLPQHQPWALYTTRDSHVIDDSGNTTADDKLSI